MLPPVARVHEIVSAIEPWDDHEARQRADVLDWLAAEDDVFRRARPATPPKHLVSYAVVVDGVRRSMLLVEHRDAGLHLPAGGHVDPGEAPSDAALREAAEELGVAASFLPSLGARPLMVSQTKTVGVSAGHTDVSLWYVLNGDAEATMKVDVREFAGWRWWTFDEVLAADPSSLDPHLGRFTAKLADHMAAGAASEVGGQRRRSDGRRMR